MHLRGSFVPLARPGSDERKQGEVSPLSGSLTKLTLTSFDQTSQRAQRRTFGGFAFNDPNKGGARLERLEPSRWSDRREGSAGRGALGGAEQKGRLGREALAVTMAVSPSKSPSKAPGSPTKSPTKFGSSLRKARKFEREREKSARRRGENPPGAEDAIEAK